MHFCRLYDYQNLSIESNDDTPQLLEYCYYISSTKSLRMDELYKLNDLLSVNKLQSTSAASTESAASAENVIEIGPKLHYESVWCTNVKSILKNIQLTTIDRIEKSSRYVVNDVSLLMYDKMTETIYQEPLKSFEYSKNVSNGIIEIPISKIGIYSEKKSLGFDDSDIKYYTELYTKLERNPTNVELYDLAQSNSEHSRHHIFRGELYIEVPSEDEGALETTYLLDNNSLMDYVKKTIHSKTTNANSIVGIGNFPDNSSAIRGRVVSRLKPVSPNEPSLVECVQLGTNTLFTAETHNFPTGIAPFPGAATGTGGRIRDVQAIGRGGQFVAGTAGYAVGCLGLDSLKCIESPLNTEEYLHQGWKILKEASDGASDYGNKIGEPLILGWCRSFGSDFLINPPQHRRLDELRKDNIIESFDNVEDEQKYIKRIEWIKPIMFSGGIGAVYQEHIHKEPCEDGMVIVRVGGPAYRIGVGGGSASSMSQSQESDKYINAVQRGDPEMENRLDRFIRACISLGKDNPILSIHDQGAGGPANVTKEIAETKGAIVDIGKMYIGDKTMTSEELWVAEFQEQNTFLTYPKHIGLLQQIAYRECVDMRVVGLITNDNRFTVIDSRENLDTEPHMVLSNTFFSQTKSNNSSGSINTVVDFPLNDVLKTPKKKYYLPSTSKCNRTQISRNSYMAFRHDTTDGLIRKIEMVLRNPAVGSKRFLTNKVDRSVSGLIAQQQCVGPLHTPLSNVGVISHSYFDNTGAATAIGERAIVGITHPTRMARLSVGEMLTNIVWAPISSIKDIKCSVNWMWPAKSPVEKKRLYDAVRAISNVMIKLGVAIDGGKDSLSMSAKTKMTNRNVDSPPQVVVSGYVECTNISNIITPNFKSSNSDIIYIDLGNAKYRLGSSIYATTFIEDYQTSLTKLHNCLNTSTIIDVCDLEDTGILYNVFEVIQDLIKKGMILSGHDRSDGGLIAAISEMCISGCLGCDIDISATDMNVTSHQEVPLTLERLLFSEELGLLIEVDHKYHTIVENVLKKTGARVLNIGKVTAKDEINIVYDETKLHLKVSEVRTYWEHTSFEMEKLQANNECVKQERDWMDNIPINFGQDFEHRWSKLINSKELLNSTVHIRKSANIPDRMLLAPRVAIIRAQGSNGDKEMMSAFWMAGFDVWDVTMTDLLEKRSNVNDFRCIAFVGGFSFADALGSANGWYSTIEHTPHLKNQFREFFRREDTCSLGICNGFQLLARLGWLGTKFEIIQNTSKRFESRFVEMTILPSLISGNHENVWLNDMDSITFGIWVAHGEGRVNLSEDYISNNLQQFPLRYTNANDDITPTMQYPCNPNGSPLGVAGMVSKNGRHLGLMPHPERCVKTWQLPWCPHPHKTSPKLYTSSDESTEQNEYTPWIKMFQSAYNYCTEK